jgi:DNA polymerase III epsilon subunit-like protein
MTLARDALITAIDFEGTGAVSGWRDEPWQVGLIALRQGRVVPESAFESLLRIGDRPFNRHAPGRHAQWRDQMRTAPDLPALWPGLGPRLEGSVLAAHNPATERRYLSHAFPLHPPGITLDTLALTRLAYPKLAAYRLGDLLERLCLTPRVQQLVPERGPHDALYDATGCAVLLEHILALPGWDTASVETLVQAQTPRGR